jgi:hypothetical protein
MINVSQNQWMNKEEITSPTFSFIYSDLDLPLIPYGKTLNLVTTNQSNTHQIDNYFFTLFFNYISFKFSSFNYISFKFSSFNYISFKFSSFNYISFKFSSFNSLFN